MTDAILLVVALILLLIALHLDIFILAIIHHAILIARGGRRAGFLVMSAPATTIGAFLCRIQVADALVGWACAAGSGFVRGACGAGGGLAAYVAVFGGAGA